MTIDTLAIIGVTGSSGACALREAHGKVPRIVGIDKTLPDAEDRLDGVDYHQADVLGDDLAPLLAGCDAVIGAIGLPFTPSNIFDPPPIYAKGMQNVLAAMRSGGVRRLTVISAAFVVPQMSLPSWFAFTVVPALHEILEQMRAMERMVEAEPELDWTIVRPGWLLAEPAGNALLVGDGKLAAGAFRCREGDLGKFLVDCTLDGSHIGRKPAIGSSESPRHEGPQAMGAEMMKILSEMKC